VALERCRQILSLSGIPGSCGCAETIRGEDWKGPRRISSVSSRAKGPDILPATSSLERYSWIKVIWGRMDGLLGIITVCKIGGIKPKGKPNRKLLGRRG
jgi:hypothetical protein